MQFLPQIDPIQSNPIQSIDESNRCPTLVYTEYMYETEKVARPGYKRLYVDCRLRLVSVRTIFGQFSTTNWLGVHVDSLYSLVQVMCIILL